MIDKPCPHCGQTHPATVARRDDGAGCSEWENSCGRWTVKDGDTAAYAFFPPDVDAIESDAIEPLFSQ